MPIGTIEQFGYFGSSFIPWFPVNDHRCLSGHQRHSQNQVSSHRSRFCDRWGYSGAGCAECCAQIISPSMRVIIPGLPWYGHTSLPLALINFRAQIMSPILKSVSMRVSAVASWSFTWFSSSFRDWNRSPPVHHQPSPHALADLLLLALAAC